MGARDEFIEQLPAEVSSPAAPARASGGLFLSAAELQELTGYQKSGAQIRWLRERCWPFEINGARRPVVLRDALMHRLGGSTGRASSATGPKLRLPL